jgi:Flp pilus assembly protein TadG
MPVNYFLNSITKYATSFNGIRKIAKNFRYDTSGVAAIEMAFSLPVLMFLCLGGLELANLMLIHSRVNQIALAVSDNASRIAPDPLNNNFTVRETDVNDVFTGATLQANGLDLVGRGRIILSSLEKQANGQQTIRWQRCFGNLPRSSTYGTQGSSNPTGMGPANRQVRATDSFPVMFVEIFYEYEPLVWKSLAPSEPITYSAAYMTRDNRNVAAGITNPSPSATVNECTTAAPLASNDDGNNGHGNDAGGVDNSNPGGGKGGKKS